MSVLNNIFMLNGCAYSKSVDASATIGPRDMTINIVYVVVLRLTEDDNFSPASIGFAKSEAW